MAATPTPRPELTGATVVITGASSGLGRGVALALAASGANVVLAARRADLIEELAAKIIETGGNSLAVTTDVSREEDVSRLAAAAVDRFGQMDVWVNNVGVGALGLFWDVPAKDHARVVDVNLKGLVFGACEALARFRAQGFGTLVNIGSIDSEMPLAYQASYAATKAAVRSLGRSLNEELRLAGFEGIHVCTVMPWAVDTPWWIHAANYTGRAPRMAAMDEPAMVIDAIVRACVEPEEEIPVGAKARVSNASHQWFPELAERLSAQLADREIAKADPLPHTSGAIHAPMKEGAGINGGIRDRMAREDAQRH